MMHLGWTYRQDDDPDAKSVRRLLYSAWHAEGHSRVIDHTGYEVMSAEAFRAHIDAGFPPRRQLLDKHSKRISMPWDNASIIQHAKELVE